MRVLLVTSNERDMERFGRTLFAEGHEIGAPVMPADVMAAVRDERPDALVVGPAEPEVLHLIVQRAREAAERQLPTVVVASDGSAWVHGAMSAGLAADALVIASRAADHGLVQALAQIEAQRLAVAPIEGSAGVRSRSVEALPLRYDPSRRAVEGPGGLIALTPWEAAVLRALIEADRGVVEAAQLASVLWADPWSTVQPRCHPHAHLHAAAEAAHSRAGWPRAVAAGGGIPPRHRRGRGSGSGGGLLAAC